MYFFGESVYNLPRAAFFKVGQPHKKDRRSKGETMNYCRKCGMKLKDGVNICPRCKSDQKELEAKIAAYEQEVKAKKKRKKKIITIISCCCAAAVLIAAGIVTYILTRPEAIDLTDFLVVEYTGEDGDATATFSFDTEAFYEAYADRIELSDEDVLESILSLTDDDVDTAEYEIEYLFENFVSGTLSPDSGLSVGDYVSFIWDVDEDSIEELYGIEVVYEDQILTVDEITEETSDDDEDTDDEDADEEDTDSEDAEEDTDSEETEDENSTDSEDADTEDTGDEDSEETDEADSTDSEDSGDDSEEETEAEETETDEE